MDESNLRANSSLTPIGSNEEVSSSSFVVQTSLNNHHHEEKSHHQQSEPLLISQIYEEQFFDHFHVNYYGELEHQGLFVASVRSIPSKTKETDNSETNDDENLPLVHALIRTENNNYYVSERLNINHVGRLLDALMEKAQLPSIHYYESIDYIKANEKLIQFDKWNDDQYSIKVAFIFQRSNQRTENEIFSNNQMSEEMENFLNLIGERIQLKDFHQYRGDLDTKENLHGIYSYFTKFQNHQIMFNISPMILSDENDQEFIQRKSLIANALICIIFQEKGTNFYQPNMILGKVTQVYIVIQPIENNGELYYKIEMWRRSDIEPIVNPLGGLWKHNQSLRNDFLTLILNTMNIILKKDFFHLRIVEQRQRQKTESLEKLYQFFNSFLKPRLSMSNNKSDENLNIPTSNLNKGSARKHRRHSFLPKLIATFSSNRPEPLQELTTKNRSSSSSRISFPNQQELTDRLIDGSAYSSGNVNKSTESILKVYH